MGTARGESGIYFGTDVGKWGPEGAGNCFGLPKGETSFSTPGVPSQSAQTLLSIQMSVKSRRNILTP